MSSGYKLMARIATSVLEGVMDGLINSVGKDGLALFIKNKWSLVEAMLMAVNESDDYVRSVSPDGYGETAVKVKNLLKKVFDFLIVFSSNIASHVPDETLDKYLSYDYVIDYLKKNKPEVADLILSFGDEGRQWLEMNLQHIKALLRGKAAWDPSLKKLVLKMT
jgi:hypothetical protein